MSSLNPIVVIRHAVFAVMLNTQCQTVLTPKTPLISSHFAPETIHKTMNAAQSTAIFNDTEK